MSEQSSPNLPEQVISEQTLLQLPSSPEWIEPAVEYLKNKAVLCGACSETRSGNLLIALHEAITNSIIHGNLEVASSLKEHGDSSFMFAVAGRVGDPQYADRLVEVAVSYNSERCQWTIEDQGPGFDHERVLERLNSDDPDVLLASGRGILMMRSFMDEVRYEEKGRRVILTLFQESGTEKRKQHRVAQPTPLKVAPIREDGSIDWDAAYAAVARNISTGGVGLIQDQLSKSNRILIGIPSGKESVYFPAEIRHWRSLEGDVVELGCRFTSEKDHVDSGEEPAPRDFEEPVGRMLDSLKQKEEQVVSERAFKRFAFTKRIEIVTKTGSAPIAGFSRDLSRGGIAFLTTQELDGEVTVIIPNPDDKPSFRVLSEIVRCTKLQDRIYDVGARFLSMVGEEPDAGSNQR